MQIALSQSEWLPERQAPVHLIESPLVTALAPNLRVCHTGAALPAGSTQKTAVPLPSSVIFGYYRWTVELTLDQTDEILIPWIGF